MKIVLKLGKLSIALGPWWSFKVNNYIKGYGLATLEVGPLSVMYIHHEISVIGCWGLVICSTNEKGL